MIDPTTGWIEICSVPSAWADLIANQVELAWLTHYPLPNKGIVHRGNEFLAKFTKMIINDYSIKVKPITFRNPQANAMLERVHQTICNILCTLKVQNMLLDNKNPWGDILASTMFVLRDTVHTTTQYSPAQPMYGRNSIINGCHDVDCKIIRNPKQDLINKGNKHENRNQINHLYKQGDKVLPINVWNMKFNQDAFIHKMKKKI